MKTRIICFEVVLMVIHWALNNNALLSQEVGSHFIGIVISLSKSDSLLHQHCVFNQFFLEMVQKNTGTNFR